MVVEVQHERNSRVISGGNGNFACCVFELAMPPCLCGWQVVSFMLKYHYTIPIL